MKKYSNSITSAKVLSPLTGYRNFANKQWIYNFRELFYFDEKILIKQINSLQKQYGLLTKNWSENKNSEWICRIYFSAKMVLHASLQLMNLEFSESKNVRLTSSYLKYYALLTSARAIITTLPTIDWNSGKITLLSHKKIINHTVDYIKLIHPILSIKLSNAFKILKAHRELITYRAPTIGDNIISNNIQDNYLQDIGINTDEIIYLCTTLVEIAQFNSEILESSIQKNAKEEYFKLHNEYIQQLSIIEVDDLHFFDKEDDYRLNYFRRKYPIPTNILHNMTEGLTEDFFGAWEPDEYEDDLFVTGSPCCWQIIFDIP